MSAHGGVPSLGVSVDGWWRDGEDGPDGARFKQAILSRRHRYADLLSRGAVDHTEDSRGDASQGGAS